MRISDNELKRVLQVGVLAPNDLGDAIESPRPTDWRLIAKLVQEVEAMPDREDMIAALKARIEAGEYNPTAEEIVEAMVRRTVADSIH